MRRPFRANYSEDELIVLLDEWETWNSAKYRGATQMVLRLMDVERALKHLSPPQREALVLIGMYQMTTREAAKAAGITQPSMWERYQRGLTNMARYLNGG